MNNVQKIFTKIDSSIENILNINNQIDRSEKLLKKINNKISENEHHLENETNFLKIELYKHSLKNLQEYKKELLETALEIEELVKIVCTQKS